MSRATPARWYPPRETVRAAPLGALATAVLLVAASARAQSAPPAAQPAPAPSPPVAAEVRIEATPPPPPVTPAIAPVVVRAPATPTGTLRIEADEPVQTTVASLGYGLGPGVVRCTTPCALGVPVGLYRVVGVQPDGRRTGGQVTVPSNGVHVRLRRAGSPAGGIALAALGGAADITGLVLGIVALNAGFSCSFFGGGCGAYTDLIIASTLTSVAGTALLAGGIVWAVLNARGGIAWQRYGSARRSGPRWAFAPAAWATGAGAAALVRY